MPKRFGIAPLSRSSAASAVLAQRQQDVDPQRAVDERGQGRVEAVVLAVVGEVLLRLVEDQVDVALRLRARRDVDERAALDAGGLGDRSRERLLGRLAPAREHDDERLPPAARASARATLASSSDDFPTPLGP